jgi:molecular chaperone GrpE
LADEKGKFNTLIDQSAIDAAMASVDKVRKGGDESASAAEVTALKAEVDQLKKMLEFSQQKGVETLGKLREEHDRVLRAAADLDNQKKRAQREKEESARFGLEKFLKDMLPVSDDLDRALAHADATDKAQLLQGLKMVMKKLETVFAKQGLKSFSATGQAFDPRVHEAMAQVEVDGPSQMVHEEYVRGWNLHDRLIRAAVVSVTRQRAQAAKPPAPAAPAASVAPAEVSPVAKPEAAEGAAPSSSDAPNPSEPLVTDPSST